MKLLKTALHLSPLLGLLAHAQQPNEPEEQNTPLVEEANPAAPPANALKYHAALRKNPRNTTLFSRFHDKWLDERSIDSLTEFLTSKAKSGDGEDLTLLALHFLRRGNEEQALNTLNRAIERQPSDSQLLLERGKILLRRLDFNSARKDLESVAEENDDTPSIEAAKLVGKSHLREGKPNLAFEAWEKLLKKHPGNEELLEDLVELSAASEQLPQAIKFSEKLIITTVDPFKKAQRKIRLGELLSDSGETDKAVDLWATTLSETGEGSWLESEIISQIAKSYRRRDRIDALTSKFEELATANPRRLLIHRELAKLEATSGEIDSAIGRFREVLRRSPGNAKLREEFIRLLIDSERFADATAELEKMISLSPNDPELHLRKADLAKREAEINPDNDDQVPPAQILASLEKALSVLPPGEPSGIRIASLMLSYDFEKEGEKLLKELSSEQDATSAPAETLAAEYARTDRKEEALTILKDIAKSSEVETILRAASSIVSLGKPEAAFEVLASRLTEFDKKPSYLTAFAKASIAAKRTEEAIEPSIRLVSLSKLPQEIIDSTRLATNVITAAKKSDEVITSLKAKPSRKEPETCLLASLLEKQSKSAEVDALFADTTESTLLRFHASLLSQRGDFLAAIAAFKLIEKTGAGNRASYFKELSELQIRANLLNEALATLEKWKVAAPTAKTPWTVTTRLLSQTGRVQEAIENTRGALTRFSDDQEISSTLSQLYQSSGQPSESERILWRLYDKAPDTTAQSNWASRLAQLARQTGTTSELREKFEERARSNNRSIGPILALTEIARAENNRKSIREYLIRAVRIKPTDIGIRLQLAEAEAQAGNLAERINVLSAGLSNDPDGRLRSSLAQAHISNGDIMKGMRILRSLAGEKASDPRSVENLAISLVRGGMVHEAIQYLREALPDGGDWRTRFLLASILETDGLEAEAATLYISLLDAENEIPGLQKNGSGAHLSHHYSRGLYLPMGHQLRQFQNQNGSTAQITLTDLINAIILEKTSRLQTITGNSSQLPSTLRQLKITTQVKLAALANLSNADVSEKIKSTEIENIHFLADAYQILQSDNESRLALFRKHPNQPGILDFILQYGLLKTPNSETLTLIKRLVRDPKINPSNRFAIATILTQSEPKTEENWQVLITAANEVLTKEPQKARNICSQLLLFLSYQKEKFAESQEAKIKEVLLRYIDFEETKKNPYDNFRLGIIAIAGTRQQWITAVNEGISQYRTLRKQESSEQSATRHSSIGFAYHGSYQGFNLNPPSLSTIPLVSIPANYLHITPHVVVPNSNTIASTELIDDLDRFDSPVFRAYVALGTGKKELIEKHLAVSPPEIEETDFKLLRAYAALGNENFTKAIRLFNALTEEDEKNPRVKPWAQSAIIATALKMEPAKRTEFETELRSVLVSMKAMSKNIQNPYQQSPWGTHSYQVQTNTRLSQLSKIAEKLGFDDLVETTKASNISSRATTGRYIPSTFQPRPAVITPSRPSRLRSRPSNPLDRFKRFARDEKHTAAARELLLIVRKSHANQSDPSHSFRQLSKSINDEIRTELISMADPGESSSKTKHMEFIQICFLLGKDEEALVHLEKLASDRPFDPEVNLKLAFSLPKERVDEASKLLIKFSGEPSFARVAQLQVQKLSNNRRQPTSDQDILFFFELITRFLETVPPNENPQQTLNWTTSPCHSFFSGNWLSDRPNLFSTPSKDTKPKKNAEAHARIANRMALAMLRHPLLAENGFRLINHATWKRSDEDMDAWARQALLQTSQLDFNYFAIRSSIPENRSSATWLASRLNDSKQPEKIIPADFLASIEKQCPETHKLLEFFVKGLNPEVLASLWNPRTQQRSRNPNIKILRDAALKKAIYDKEAQKFFIARMKAISEEEKPNPLIHLQFLQASLKFCEALDQAETEQVCKILAKLCFTKSESNSRPTHFAHEIFNNFSADPVTISHIIRAFDSPDTPIGSLINTRSSVRASNIKTPEAAIEIFEKMGLLNDLKTWEPIATYTIQNTNVSGVTETTPTRIVLDRSIGTHISRHANVSKIIPLLEERKPKTFGALVTAASLASSKKRDELLIEAFELAKPSLKKFSPERLDDFHLIALDLPYHAIASLPPYLREKNEAAQKQKIETYVANIDQQLTAQYIHSGRDLHASTRGHLTRLASIDPDRAAELFLKIDDYSVKNPPARNSSRINSREQTLEQILQTISSAQSSDPTAPIRFYTAIRNSPIGDRFGISTGSGNKPYLTSVASSLAKHDTAQTNTSEPAWLHPWKAAINLPEKFRQTAIAAAICSELDQQKIPGSYKPLDTVKHTDKTLRKYILICIGIRSWQNIDEEQRTEIANSFVSVLRDSKFSQDARDQIALTASYRNPQILTDPRIAEAVAKTYARISEKDRSVVDAIFIGILSAIQTINTDEKTLPHLRLIHDSFWENANAPKNGGHFAIQTNYVESLFLTAIIVGDEKTATRLFPEFRNIRSGHIASIVKLISLDSFNFAASLLADENQTYQSNNSLRYTEELEKKLISFRETVTNADRLLRFECELLQIRDAKGRTPTSLSTADRRSVLVERYIKHPPETAQGQLEALGALATDRDPKLRQLDSQVIEFTKSLEASEIIRKMHDSSPSQLESKNNRLRWKLLCKSAFIQLRANDPAPLIALCQAIEELATQPEDRSSSVLSTLLPQIETHLAPTLFWLVSVQKTESFASIVDPLAEMAVALANMPNFNRSQIYPFFSALELVAYWEGKPEIFKAAISQEKLKDQRFVRNFIGNDSPLSFILNVQRFLESEDNITYMEKYKEAFTHAILRKDSVAELLLSDPLYVRGLNLYGFNDQIQKLANTPPKDINSGGLALLHFHKAILADKENEPQQAIESLRNSLKAIPENDVWRTLNIAAKCRLVEMLSTSEDGAEEMTKLFDSISEENVPQLLKTSYESARRAIPRGKAEE
ncbi:MAG: tetratricopeptide repeat protein [Akkermansiaceae bacterium]